MMQLLHMGMVRVQVTLKYWKELWRLHVGEELLRYSAHVVLKLGLDRVPASLLSAQITRTDLKSYALDICAAKIRMNHRLAFSTH